MLADILFSANKEVLSVRLMSHKVYCTRQISELQIANIKTKETRSTQATQTSTKPLFYLFIANNCMR